MTKNGCFPGALRIVQQTELVCSSEQLDLIFRSVQQTYIKTLCQHKTKINIQQQIKPYRKQSKVVIICLDEEPLWTISKLYSVELQNKVAPYPSITVAVFLIEPLHRQLFQIIMLQF